MNVQVITVPYDSGHPEIRMGRGPQHIVSRGVERILRACGHSTQVERIEAQDTFRTEVTTSFQLNRLLAERVRAARSQGRFPLVLAGNCGSSLGTLAGLDPARLGIVWFDGHGDFNTPETTISGFIDGMALATATGRCWTTLAATIPGFRPVPENNVIHLGARDLDPGERRLLESSGLALVEAERVRQLGPGSALTPVLARLAARVQQVYLHIDLDVLDPAEAPANEFAPPDGLNVDQAEEAIRMIGERFQVCAGGIAAYDPAYDTEDRALHAAFRLMRGLVPADRDPAPDERAQCRAWGP